MGKENVRDGDLNLFEQNTYYKTGNYANTIHTPTGGLTQNHNLSK